MVLPTEHCCGAVVFTRDYDSLRYIVIVSQKGHWGFPKGHMEAGETEHETALREIREETDLRVTFIDGFRATDARPVIQNGHVVANKEIVLFLAEYSHQQFTPDASEILEIRLLPFEEAHSKLHFESNKRILSEAHAFLNQTGCARAS